MYFCALLSPPVMAAMTSPVLPSLLTNSGAADAGVVHAEVTSATCGEACSLVTMSVPTARDCGLCVPASGRDADDELHIALTEIVDQHLARVR